LRWYLRWPSVCLLDTVNPLAILGSSIQNYLRKAEPVIKRLFTELQMLLAKNNLNQQLITPVTGLWFWGGGYLTSIKICSYDAVVGENVIALGLSKLYNIAYYQTVSEVTKTQNMLWVIEDYHKVKEELTAFLKKIKEDDCLVIYTENAQCRIYQSEHFLGKIKKYFKRFRSLVTH
jgi:hypothetical protein